jgi:hypothetical protein
VSDGVHIYNFLLLLYCKHNRMSPTRILTSGFTTNMFYLFLIFYKRAVYNPANQCGTVVYVFYCLIGLEH